MTRPHHAIERRYLLPRLSVRGLLTAIGAVVTFIAWTRP